MEFKYFLTYKGNEIEVDEPIGFDKFRIKMERKENIALSRTYSETELTFVKESFTIVNDAYNAEGVDAEVWLRIESRCSNFHPWEILANGVLDFIACEIRTTPYCAFTAHLGQRGDEMSFMSRRKVKVDMDAKGTFEGKEIKEAIGKEIDLPAKVIRSIGRANDEVKHHIFYYSGTEQNTYDGIVNIPFTISSGDLSINTNNLILNIKPNIEYAELIKSKYAAKGKLKVNIQLKMPGWVGSNYIFDETIIRGCYLAMATGTKSDWKETILKDGERFFDGEPSIDTNRFRISFDEEVDYELAENESLFLYVNINYHRNSKTLFESWVTFESNDVNISIDTSFDATPAKAYPIHEVMNKIATVTTNNAITVKSDFYGRYNSPVNPAKVDGPASLRCLTNGYNIRQAKLQDGPVQTFVDWDTLFKSLAAIDNIGYVVEGNKLVVENYEYFFKDNIIFDASRASDEVRSFDQENAVQALTIGYEKWEAETDNGIDGFHGKRQYRTESNNLNNERKITSKLIADGYAIEGTRRRQIEDNSKDWRYDNDLFIIDMKRDATGALVVNQGVTGTKGTLVDESTIYNARLSPARMAMRWRNNIVQAVRVGNNLIYAGTEGYANAKMLAAGNYVIEKDVIDNDVLYENKDITDDCYREVPEQLFCSQLVEFKHPLTVTEFNAIKADPHGLVKFPGGEGWIKELDWDTAKFLGNFTLIVKRGKADPLFRWVDSGTAYCQLSRRGNNNGNRMQPQKRQYSTDGGATWLDVVPPTTRETSTLDKVLCPVIPQDLVVTMTAEIVKGYIEVTFTTDELVMSDLLIKYKIIAEEGNTEYTVSFPKNTYKVTKINPYGSLKSYQILSITPSSDETWNYKAE